MSFVENRTDRLTHYMFRYPAKFHPPVVRALIHGYTEMDRNAQSWRGVLMDAPHWELVQAGVSSLSEHPIVVQGFAELLAA